MFDKKGVSDGLSDWGGVLGNTGLGLWGGKDLTVPPAGRFPPVLSNSADTF